MCPMSSGKRRYWSQAMSAVSPLRMRPGVCVKRYQLLGPAPSASGDPSTWNAEVAAPHRKS